MNFKLKGIELDAFRVYQDKQLFNFLTKSGKVANLVVIYAPNGYGKTSFIDAIEWGLTGKIERISRNSIIRNTADSEKGAILKNRKSAKEFGTVKLIAENGGCLEKNTKIIGRNGRKTDYADGDIVVKAAIFDDINFSEFITKSILGQDKIDSFLRSFSPKDRYDILTNFWDDENDSELFKNILGMNIESEKQLLKTKEQLDEIDNEIQSLIIRPNIIAEINNLVNKFNLIQLKNFNLPLLDRNNNKQFVNALIETNSKLELINVDNEARLLISGYLVENYGSYSLNNIELNHNREKIKEIIDILNKFKNREKSSDYLDTIKSKSFNFYKKYKKFNELEKQYNQYEKILIRINNLEGLNRGLLKEISNFTNTKTQEEQKLKEIQNNLKIVEKTKEDIENNFSKLDRNLEKFNSLERKKIHLTKRLSQIQVLINVRWKNKHELKEKMLTLESYSKYELQNIIKINIDNKQIKTIISEIKNSFYFLISKEQELKKIDQEYIQFGKLNEQLNIIYKAGKKFIEESRPNTCPLCKKEYEDFNILISNVDRDFSEVGNLNKIKSEIEDIKKILKEEENKIDQLITIFKKEMNSEITKLSMKNIVNEAKITSYDSLNLRIKNKLDVIDKEENNLINFFKQLNIDIENRNLVYLTNVKSSIVEMIHTQSNSINYYDKEITDKSNTKKNLNEKLNEKEIEIVSNKNKIRELSEDSILKSVNQLLEELKVDDNKNKIINELEEVKQKFRMEMHNKREIKKQINILNKDLETINKQEMIGVLEEAKKNLQEIQDYIYNYKRKVNNFMRGDSFEEEHILQINKDLLNEKSNVKKGLTVLNELRGFTNYIENIIASKTKESKKTELEKQLKILEEGNKEISSAKEHISKYIENKINNTFNLDSINSIYQRIDPHPDFNNIKFEVDLSKDKTELHIYASSKQEKLAPILYFSAAQVNILSLSIFLAKALLKDQEGLNTIFMDDPIQHLDNLNILSFIDLLRTITNNIDKQVIISTHNENFYKLIKRKMDPEYTSSKFIELESFGKIKNQ